MIKNLFRNSEFQLDEIIFQNRNKQYGAYALRSESDVVLTKSMFIGIGLFAVMAATPLLLGHLMTTKNTKDIFVSDGSHVFTNVDEPEVVETAPIVVPQQQQQVQSFDSTVPTPTANPKKEEPAATIDDYDNGIASTVDIAGVKPTTIVPPTVSTPSVIVPNVPAVAAVPDPKVIVDKVDVEAKYKGGINSFREKMASNFDTSGFEGSGDMLKAVVTFVVERDGSISNIKANGNDVTFNKEAERAIRSIRGQWEPAKVNGETVRSRFSLPVSMKFE